MTIEKAYGTSQIAVAPFFLNFFEAFNRWWVEVYLVGRENQNRPDWVLAELENAYSIKWLKPVSSGPKILRSTLSVEQKSLEDSKPMNCEDTIWIANL